MQRKPTPSEMQPRDFEDKVLGGTQQTKKRTFAWAMTRGKNQPMFLCSAQPPYVMEHANAQWCEKTGFPAHIVKGSHGLAVLKGPQTDEEVVAKAWGTREASITVVHYTGTGIPVNHTVQIFPLFDEQSGKLTHFLGVSSFEKYITKGQLQIRAKAVMNANVMRAITGGKKDKQTAEGHDSDNAAAATNSEERAKQLQQRASLLLKKNAHDLRKENALKNLDKYAGILSQSNRSQVPLVTLREKEREREALNAAAQTQSVGSNADRLNAFKSRLQVAKRQAKRDKRNRAATPGSLSAVSQSPRTAAESAPPTSEPSRLATAATPTDALDGAIAIGFDASAQQQPASQERGGESERDSVSDWVASMMQ